MTAHTTLRGWPIYYDGERWRFADNDEPTAETYRGRPCGACLMSTPADGPDPCLGWLPGVMNACCGHGMIDDAYVMFNDETIVRSEEASHFFSAHRSEEARRGNQPVSSGGNYDN